MTNTTNAALASFADLTAKDTGSDTATAVRHMRDEPQEVALAVGCTVDEVIAWCDAQA